MTTPAAPTDLYLDLMAKMLTRYGFEGRNVTVKLHARSYESYLWDLVRGAMPGRDIRMVEHGEFNAAFREEGRDWPADAETMIGLKRLANLRQCVESVLADEVPGDLIETGVWRGGATIFMRAILAAHGVTDRTVWVADSFEGLPGRRAVRGRRGRPAPHRERAGDLARGGRRTTSERYGLLDDQVRVPGRAGSPTPCPTAPIDRLCGAAARRRHVRLHDGRARGALRQGRRRAAT